ncbi:MAG: glycoside hydrolase family 2 [Clostridia bacterium]|nr:glycoside hydrolase family 2 [Clostridia bacterium]
MAVIPRPEHPRPDFYRPDWLNLNGIWKFRFDDENVGLREQWYKTDAAFDREIRVPFCYQCAESGISDQSYHPRMWYYKEVEIPAELLKNRLLLRFGAVDFFCAVYVNGERVGEHTGGYDAFDFDITAYARPGKNAICLYVEDFRDCSQPRGKQLWKDRWFGCWYTPVSGIWQTVYLEAAGNIYIRTAHITPDIDQGTAALSLVLSETPSLPVTVSVSVSLEGKPVRRQTMTMSQKRQRMILDLIDGDTLHQVVLWTPDAPKLYDVEIELDQEDRVFTYFGMRKIEVVDGMVLLNNRPIYQRLVLDQGYWKDTLLTPPSDEAIRQDVEMTKRLGFNGARKHQKLEDPRYYYWADRLGLLVWEELPSAYEFSDDAVLQLTETLASGIDRDYNHPSVIAWVPLNESWGVDRIYAHPRMQAAAHLLYDAVKALDGTRLVSANDGWENTKSDIFGLHDYAETGEILARHFESQEQISRYAHRMAYTNQHESTGQEAFLLTEYGGIAFEDHNQEAWGYHDKVADAESFYRRYQSLTDAARAIPYCQGYVYTQLTDVQQETNGLLNEEHLPKIDVDRIRTLTKNPEGRYQ